ENVETLPSFSEVSCGARPDGGRNLGEQLVVVRVLLLKHTHVSLPRRSHRCVFSQNHRRCRPSSESRGAPRSCFPSWCQTRPGGPAPASRQTHGGWLHPKP